jgi:hypothetical protein
MKASNSLSGAIRSFAYFMSSGSHWNLQGTEYLKLYGEEPSAIETTYAIFVNVLEMDEQGNVLNFDLADKRATDYLRAYLVPEFIVDPPFEEWEVALYQIPR